jgi:hypothetical protein
MEVLEHLGIRIVLDAYHLERHESESA